MAATAEADTDESTGGLTTMDWIVIIAATIAIALTLMWLIQGPPKPRRTEPAPDE